MAMSGAGITLRLLGEMEVLRGQNRVDLPPSRKSRALLAYLAATARPQRRERLCALLWDVPDDPKGSLRWSLSRLRAVLDDGETSCIVANRETVALDTSRCSIDLLSVRALGGGSSKGLEGQPTEQLLTAAGAFRGEFMEGLDLPNSHEFQSWCLAEREELRRLNIELLAELRRRHDAEPEAALGFARRLVHIDPFDEAARIDLLRLLLLTKRRREATGQFATAERLFQELGEGSAERLTRAWRLVLREAEQAATAAAQGADTSPPSSPSRQAPAQRAATRRAAQAPASAQSAKPAMTATTAPFVGRSWMLNHLASLMDIVATRRTAQIVLLNGEPGLGKSRLLAELAARAQAQQIRVFVGHCYDARSGVSYAPWEEALGELPPLDEEGEADLRRRRLFQAVARTVTDGQGLTLLALEDVHWMDEASCDLLRFVVRTAREEPLLVLLTAREGEVTDNPAIAEVLRDFRLKYSFEGLHLLPLGEEEVRQLAEASGREDAAARIATLSRGNPLYAVELARGLTDKQEALPGSLKELIRDRLAQLAPEAAEVLRWASLFSTGACSQLLQDLSELQDGPYLHALELLDRHRLLVQEAGSDHCTFGHELVRQAVYTSLSEPRRRLMHRKVARFMWQNGYQPKFDPFDIVHHAAAGSDDVLAAQACVHAGQRARRLLANAEALMLVRRGQHYAQALPEPLRSERLIELMEIELAARPIEAGEKIAQGLEQLAGTALDHDRPDLAWRCYKMMADIRWAQGSWSDARMDSLHAELISRSASEEERVSALGEAARCLTMLERDLEVAQALVLEGQALSHRLGMDSDAIADARGLLAAYRGDHEEARESFVQARLLARRSGHRLEEFLALSHLVILELEQENWEGVSRHCEEMSTLAERIRPGSEQPFAAAVRELCRYISGRSNSLEALESALQALRFADSKHHISIVCLSAAGLFLQRGDLARARQLAAEALDVAGQLNRRRTEAAALNLLIEIADAAGDDKSLWITRLTALAPIWTSGRPQTEATAG
jgi:DNA-binding SARP family transcriptional activator